jgi:acyl-CoA dehydrogenase
MIDFVLSKKQQELKEGIHNVGKYVIRPMSLEMDRNHEVPEPFLRNFMKLAGGRGGQDIENFGEDGSGEEEKAKSPDRSKPTEANRTSAVGAEELAWADAAMVLCMPGAGLGGPPVKSTGTPEQKKRFLGMFKGMDTGPLKWGAYGLTEPGAGSDVSGIRSSCRKDGKHWVLNGRKCYITNGGRAIWTVIFATVDPALGRAGHRAFVVEKGTPGFEVGKIEEKMGLRANETAELVLEDCRVPEENLLGGEEAYHSKEGFMTAMKTFDNTRPLVGAMAVGIGRAAYEYARDFVKENYLIGRPIPRYAAIAAKLSQVSRKLDAARMLVWRATYMADMGIPNAKEASMSKAAAGQAATQACIDAIEICGAHGSIATEHALLEKWFRDIKVYDIFEGTGNIQRIVIAKRIMPGLKAF